MERKGIKFFKRKIFELEIKKNINKRVGRLTILEYIPPFTILSNNKKSDMSYVKCKCDCGNFTYISWNKLKTSHTKSCGCFGKELHNFSNKEKITQIKLINSLTNIELFSIEEKK